MTPTPKAVLSVLFLLLYAFAKGQPDPLAPIIDCASTNQSTGDVVINFNPNSLNSCGSFVDYKIYGSANGAAYVLVGTITNPNITIFTHTGANGTTTTWCYEVAEDRDCPGLVTDISTPVCAQLLDIPAFTYVTVTPSGVQVNWTPSVSPAVFSYVILYIDQSTGLSISLDTILASTGIDTFLDNVNNPNNGLIQYTIKSLDACKTSSIQQPLQHNTIFLSQKSNPCLQKTTVSWNRYANWPGDTVAEYLLQVAIDTNAPTITSLGNPFQAGTPITATQSYDYSIAGLVGNNICFTIIAVDANGIYRSNSNQVCVPLNVLRSTKYIYASYASVVDTNVIAYSWLIDTTAQVDTFFVSRSTNGQTFNRISTLNAGTNSVFEVTYTDSSVKTASGSYYYEVESKDICGFTLNTPATQTIFLTVVSLTASDNHLSWNAFVVPNGTVLNYTIYRVKKDGSIFPVTTVLPDSLEYDDIVGNAITDDGSFCYRIVANYVLNIPDIGLSKSYTTRSNDECIAIDPVIYIPTAFAPGGVNNIFRPVLLFGVAHYDFKIFDRWGKELFNTQDYVAGWDGTYRGEKLPLGGYVYELRVTSATGATVERSGVVALIR